MAKAIKNLTAITARELWIAVLICASLALAAVMINNGAMDEMVADVANFVEIAIDKIGDVVDELTGESEDAPTTPMGAWNPDRLPSTNEFAASGPDLAAIGAMPIIGR